MMHTVYAWCVLTLSEVRLVPMCFTFLPLIFASKAKAYGLSNVANGSFDWARDRLVLIGTKLGSRAKNSVLRMRF
jgi:hypothetical protein